MSPSWFPIFLDLSGAVCLVVGAGAVSTRKARAALEAGAVARVVAPEVCEEMRSLAGERLTIETRPWRPSDLDGVSLVFTAASDPAVNAQVAREARARRIPVNSADDPGNCTFILPAVLRRGTVCVAVGTGGASPSLSRTLRDRLETVLPPEIAVLAGLLSALRPEVRRLVPDAARRRRLLAALSDPAWADAIRQRGREAVEAEMRALIAGQRP